jgi:hypothetical protein
MVAIFKSPLLLSRSGMLRAVWLDVECGVQL